MCYTHIPTVEEKSLSDFKIPFLIGLLGLYPLYSLVLPSFLSYSILYGYMLIFMGVWFNFRQQRRLSELAPQGVRLILVLLFFWLVVSFMRGAFILETYWDVKTYFTSLMAYSLLIFIYVGMDIDIMGAIYRFWLKYIIWFFPLFQLCLESGVSVCLMPIGFLLIFIEKLPWRWALFMLIAVIQLMVWDFSARTVFIKFLGAILLGFGAYLLPKARASVIPKIMHCLFIILPWIFLWTSVNYIFNPFQLESAFSSPKIFVTSHVGEELLLADSRTFLYEEVFHTLSDSGSWVAGRSPALGYVTYKSMFADVAMEFLGRPERYGSEVGILNIFLWFGCIGVALFFGVFLVSSSLAVYCSNNRFVQLLGVYVSFLWSWSWVWGKESFSSYYLFSILIMGLCISPAFRKMTEKEFSIWLNGMLPFGRDKKLQS